MGYGTLDALSPYQTPSMPEFSKLNLVTDVSLNKQGRRCAVVISKKAIIAGVFSAIIGVGMLAMPVKAMARDWDHDGDGGRHENHDNGRHNGWYNQGGGNNGWYNHRGQNEEEEEEHEGRGYYQQPRYGYGYQEPEDEGYGYGRQFLPRNGAGMVNPRHPGLAWACDSQGHHCHWARRAGYGNGYYGNTGYGNYGNNGYYGNSPLGGLGSLLGIMP
jgi:hypothetical protein